MGWNVALIREIAKLLAGGLEGEAKAMLDELDQAIASMWWVSNDIRVEAAEFGKPLSQSVQDLCSMVEELKDHK